MDDELHPKRLVVRADESLMEFFGSGTRRFALAANDWNTCLLIGAKYARKLELPACSLFYFLIDTASELLPKRFGRQGFGQQNERKLS